MGPCCDVLLFPSVFRRIAISAMCDYRLIVPSELFFVHIFAVVYAFYNVSFILTLFAGNLTPLTPKGLLEIVET